MNIYYTCITGNYDTLTPINPVKGWRYICYTDNPELKSNVWEIVYLPTTEKLFRRVKLDPVSYLPEHNISIWVDGNIQIVDNIELLSSNKNYCLMSHPDRKNIFQEAKACINYNKDAPETINKQIQHYRKLGYNEHGLVATGVLIRRNTPENNMFNKLWLNEVLKHSVRDQLSFNFVAWLCSFPYETFPFLKGCKYYKHLKK